MQKKGSRGGESICFGLFAEGKTGKTWEVENWRMFVDCVYVIKKFDNN